MGPNFNSVMKERKVQSMFYSQMSHQISCYKREFLHSMEQQEVQLLIYQD